MFCASMTSLICGHHADVSGGGTESKKGKRGTDTLLEGDQVALCERVCLGNHRDKVDAGTETFRNLSVEWLKTKTGSGETQIGIRRTLLELTLPPCPSFPWAPSEVSTPNGPSQRSSLA